MKRIILGRKIQAFTLIELLVSVTIFMIVSLVVMSVLSTGLATKSKTIAFNELRVEGAKIIVEIQDMVEKGNGSPGVYITNNNADIVSQDCTNGGDNSSDTIGSGVASFQTDSRGISVHKILFYNPDEKTLNMEKKVYGTGLAETEEGPFITNSNIEVVFMNISGHYRDLSVDPVCDKIATRIYIELELRSKTRELTGKEARLKFITTFTPKYPAPDHAADSVL